LKQQFERRFIKKLQRDEYKKGELVLVRNVGIEMEVSSRKRQMINISDRMKWNERTVVEHMS
jgi:hypothetical protein